MLSILDRSKSYLEVETERSQKEAELRSQELQNT